jgi:hypothetical protein
LATLTTQVVPHAGLAPTFAAATSGGDKAATGTGVAFAVKNGGGSSITITFAVPQTVDSLAVTSRTVSVAAGAESYIPLPDLYKNSSDGLAHITYSAVTTVTVAVLRVP